MARKYSMTWDAKNFKWQKMVDGKWFRVKCSDLGLPSTLWTKEGSGPSANAWWLAKEAELHADPVAEAVAMLPAKEVLISMIEQGELAELAQTLRKIGEQSEVVLPVEKMVDDADITPIGTEEELASSIQHVAVELNGQHVPSDFTLTYHIGQLLDGERARVASGDCKPETYGELDVYLHRLMVICEVLPPKLDVRTIDERTVASFNNWLKHWKWVKTTRRKVWRFFVRLVRYLWSMRLIELPRNLDEAKMKFKVRPGVVERFELADVQACLAALTPRQKLYACLGLNAGMLGVDMASLEWSELDQEEWRIIRQRTKTEDTSDDVPTVNYKLWPVTAELLRANLSQHKTYVLTSMRNTVLWNSYIDPVTGKRKKNDLITQQWARADAPISLKSFRSIGATIIGDHASYGRYHHHYLGHSPTSIADKHYVPPSKDLFDEIILYVGRQLGLH